VEIEGVGRQTVKSVGRHSNHLASADLLGDIRNQGRFRMFGVDFDDFGTQPDLFIIRMSGARRGGLLVE
jgi:hypothetical protein